MCKANVKLLVAIWTNMGKRELFRGRKAHPSSFRLARRHRRQLACNSTLNATPVFVIVGWMTYTHSHRFRPYVPSGCNQTMAFCVQIIFNNDYTFVLACPSTSILADEVNEGANAWVENKFAFIDQNRGKSDSGAAAAATSEFSGNQLNSEYGRKVLWEWCILEICWPLIANLHNEHTYGYDRNRPNRIIIICF